MHGRPKLTLYNRSRSSKGHDLYKFCRAPLPDASYQVSKSQAFWFWRRRLLKDFAIYSHGSHLGHVTMTIYINFHCPFSTILHIKFGFDWPSGFRAVDICILWSCRVYSPGAGADNPLGTFFFYKHKYSVYIAHCLQVLPLKSYFNNFPHSNAPATYVDLALN